MVSATSFSASRRCVSASRWHAARCTSEPSTASNAGLRLPAHVHRVGAAQVEAAPRRRPQERRRRARDRPQLLALAGEPRQRPHEPPGVGVVRVVEDVLVGALLRRLGRVHHEHLVGRLGHHAQVVRDQDDRASEVALQVVHQLQDLGLRGHVERRRGLVGDQQVGVVDERHRDHHALAHAARELVRVVLEALLGARDPHRLQHLERALAGGRLRGVLVQLHRLPQLLADRVHRVQRGHRILEDHRDLVAAHLAQLRRRQLEQVAALEDRLARRDRLRSRVQPEDRQAGDALAAARLADDRERLALLDREGDAVDRADDAVVGTKLRLQVADVEERHVVQSTGVGPTRAGCAGRSMRTADRPAG